MGIFSSDEEKYYDKAHGYFDKGDFEKAMEYLDKLLEINPNSIDALSNKGITLNNMGRFDEALSYYNKVLEIEPNNTITLINKAYILMHDIKDYEEAVKYYNILLKMDKNVFKEKIEYSNFKYPDILLHIWNNKGLALFNLGKYEEAVSCYNETLKMDSNNIGALDGKKLAGNKLNNIQSSSRPNHIQVNNGMNFCPKCGTKSIVGAKFCYNCGADLTKTDAVGDISSSVNGSEKNFNHQNREYAEKPLIKEYKAQKRSKNSLISILDTIHIISIILTIVSAAIFLGLSYIISLMDQQLSEIIRYYSMISFFIFLVIVLVSSTISDRLKRHIRRKIVQTGIPAQAHIIEVDNLGFDERYGIRTAELTLEVNPKTGVSYQAKSTVKTHASDASLIFRPGSTVKVFIDPEDTSQVEVEY